MTRRPCPADVLEAHGIVREMVAETVDRQNAEGAIILYGGSVKPGNINQLLAVSGVDGVLVGGASLDPESWAAICDSGR